MAVVARLPLHQARQGEQDTASPPRRPMHRMGGNRGRCGPENGTAGECENLHLQPPFQPTSHFMSNRLDPESAGWRSPRSPAKCCPSAPIAGGPARGRPQHAALRLKPRPTSGTPPLASLQQPETLSLPPDFSIAP
ncbi:uncharacterized protein B0I36DRAFT_14742 [Microdochium trichocladiopsis]|uniref:Uncharacterized protein n=1 Tax=Microdochium trichocladiopsis TaxID=1682393 RepID=A0A9P8YIQ3_9PEZI|nr:uncharacterized protein B0I36DRAFT_14742 [Microdochium trichocladiopsis]KAH7040732.1 hypothetical protein B0I36DRAFT_14742 [Microdochium trichocladiopsis]